MATGGPFDLGIVPVDVLKNNAVRATFDEAGVILQIGTATGP
jgi:hypothetical protein